MKQLFTLFTCLLLFTTTVSAQLSLQTGTSNYLINFDATVSGVNSGNYTGSGFSTSPSSGQLDADGWATTGLSDGSKDFGTSNTSGDHARGSSSGGVSTGGLYGFDVGGGNRALGIQPTGSDWTPGTLTLKIVNNSTSVINDMTIDYTLYVRNDQGRSSSFNFSWSSNNSSYTSVTSANYTSTQTAGGSSWVANNRSVQLSNLNLAIGASFYIRWSGSDVSGSGSRDEFALDDIAITAAGSSNNCVEPSAQASNLNFGTITSNSIQASFTASAADKFLVVQSTNSSLGTVPVDGVNYSAGNTLGTGEVLQYTNSTSINSLGLSANTTYYFHIFSANDNCTGGPDYRTSNPLTGSVSTMTNGNSTYYDGIGSETCADLKTALSNLIDGHTSVSYASLWTHYQTTDDHLNDAGSATIVWDMYSDNPTGSENEFTFVSEQCGTYQSEGDCYNREHSFPKSWWGGGTSPDQYTDLYTVIPVDGWINGIRSNNPYGEIQVGTETHITNNGTALGSSSITIPGYSGSVFEPIDAYKGDLARGYFYMATRYESSIAGWENYTTESDAVLDGTSYPVYEQWMIDMLISWHNADPVDQKEIDRNEDIYLIQGNRNPFIDHPEYVALIWNNCGGGGDTQAPTAPAALAANNTTQTTTDLSWSGSTDNVGVTGYNIYQDGNLVGNSSGTSSTVTGLTANTSYSFYVTAYDAAANESATSNSVNVTTTPASDTQAPTAPSSLTANNTTQTTTDLSWSGSTDNVGVTGYNIYQDGSLVGNSSGTSSTITGLTANTSYSFYVTAYDAAANESATSNSVNVTTTSAPDTQAPTAPSTLASNNTTETTTGLSWSASTDNVAVTGYNIYQNGSLVGTSSNTSTSITGLTASTNYTFYVTAYDAAGNESTASNTIGVTTDTAPGGPVVLHEGYFESGWDGWQDGGSDCARYSGSRSAEGSYSIRIRDNSGTSSAMTSPVFDISTYSTVDFNFSFYPNSMENNEDFWLRYYDGSSWQTIATFTRGTDFNNGVFYVATVSIDNASVNFSSNAQFRLQCDASGNNDHIYIDEVVIVADAGSGSLQPIILENNFVQDIALEEEGKIQLDNTQEDQLLLENSEILVFPNPASTFINIDLSEYKQRYSRLDILNMQGQIVRTIDTSFSDEAIRQDVTNFAKGMYVLRVLNDENKATLVRFVVQ